jgi:ABC-type protease/lipase transport system fused ATPase/permease subunit
VLSQVDKILVLADGQAARYGPRDQVLAALNPQPRAAGVTAIGQRSMVAAAAEPVAGPINF